MNTPNVTADRGRYLVDWQAPHYIRFEFDLLRAERSGDLTGEVTVSQTSPSLAGHIHQARVNLTSTAARGTLARHLSGRTNGQGIDWPAAVDEACTRTLRLYRRGEPVICLRDVPEPIMPDALLPPLVIGRSVTALFGDGGTGKSYLALAIAASIHTGISLLGIAPAVQQRVLYLDWEWDGWEHRQRLRRLWGPDELPDLLYRRCAGPLSGQVDSLRREIRDEGIGYVVIDSVGYACDGPPEDAASALGFYDGLRALEVGALCTAHVNRSGDTDRPFGSAFWSNGARLTWYAKRQTDEAGGFTLGLFCRKANGTAMPAPLGLAFEFGQERTTIRWTDLADAPELATQLPVRLRLRGELRSGAQTIADLAEALEIPTDTVKKTLARGDGREFTRVTGEDGVYRWGLLHAS